MTRTSLVHAIRAAALAGAVLLCLSAGRADAQPYDFDVTVEKSGGGTLAVGQTATFSITAINAGVAPLPAGLITVTDQILAPLSTPVSASGSGWNCTVAGALVTCRYMSPTLPGASLPPITVTAIAGAPGRFTNCAKVVLGAVPDRNPGNNQACTDGVIQAPVDRFDLGIEKAVRGPSMVGQATVFTLSPFNGGPSAVGGGNGVTVTDVLPANFTGPISGSGPGWTCVVNGQLITCTYSGPSVAPGAPLPPITVSAMTKAPGAWRNCARITLRGQDANRANNEDCIPGASSGGEGRRFDIGVRKSGPARVDAGQMATFTISPFNAGPASVNGASGIRVTDLLPANFVGPVTAAGLGWTCTVSGSGPYLVTCDYFGGAVPANGLFPTITVKAKAREVGGWSNCADIELKAAPDVRRENDRSCIGGEVRPGKPDGPYDVSIRKRGPGALTAGQQATFTLAPRNNGPATVDSTSGVTVIDTLVGGLVPAVTFKTSQDWSCTVTGLKVTCDYIGGPIAAGQDFPPIIIAAMAGKPGKFSNCAVISLKAGKDIAADNNQDCVDGLITAKLAGFDVGLTKTGPANVTVGQDVFFTLTPSNNGPSPVDAGTVLVVTDSVPPNSGPMTATGAGWTCVVVVPNVTCTYTGAGVFTAGQLLPPITIKAVATWVGHVDNCALAEIDPVDLEPEDNDSCIGIQVNPAAAAMACIEKYNDLNGNGHRDDGEPLLPGFDFSAVIPNGNIVPGKTGGDGVFCWGAGAGSYTITETYPVYGWANTEPGDPTVQNVFSYVVAVAPGQTVWRQFGNTLAGQICVQKYEDKDGDGVRDQSPLEPGLPIWLFEIRDSAGNVLRHGYTDLKGNICTQHTLPPGVYTVEELLPIQSGWINTQPGANSAGRYIRQFTITPAGEYISAEFGNRKTTAPTPPDLTATKTYSGQQSNGEMNFILTASNKGPGDWAGPITFTDNLPAGLTPVSGVGVGWTCAISGQTITCAWTGAAITAGADFPVLDIHAMPTRPGTYHNCATVKADVTGWSDPTPRDNAACADGVHGPPSLIVAKSILDNCWQGQSGNDVRCTFRVTITNDGAGPWTGPLQFTDMVQPQGMVFANLVGGQPYGWSCGGSQPMTCTSSGAVTIPAGGSATVDFTVDIPSPIGASQNCVSLTSPNPAGPACAPIGSTHDTHYDLGLDNAFGPDPAAPGYYELSHWIANTPQVTLGTQITVTGSLTPAAFFSPSGSIPASAVTSPGWSCSGTWASFQCSQTATAASFTNGYLVLRLRTSYPASASGQPFTYVGAVTKANNIDPDPSDNSRTVTETLP